MLEGYAADSRRGIDRFWNRLGFGACANPNPWDDEMEGYAPSYLATNTVAVFSLWDRLKILVSGKVMVAASTKTDVVVHKALSVSSVSVLPPNYNVARPH